MDDEKRVVLSQEEFRKNIEAMYELCEAWFRGEVKHDEFGSKVLTLLTHRPPDDDHAEAVDCESGKTEQEQKVVNELESELSRTGNFTQCISMAATDMQKKGYDDSASPLTRAFFFAQHWQPEFAESNENEPPHFVMR